MKTIVFIGNSIVNGFPHKRSQCFVSRLREEGGMKTINKGENGQTTADLMERFKRDVLDHKPDFAVIMTGTNDFIYKEATVEQCVDNLMEMAEQAAASGICPLIATPILTDAKMAEQQWIPDVDYAEVNGQLLELAAKLRSQEDVGVLDLQSAYTLFSNGKKAYHDGVHPTVEGHRAIYLFLKDALCEFIK